jgi:eukaryotic-like serine/threonine-protein kinase
MVLANGVRLGPYEILAPLGAGGMGEVYRARDTRLGREVAVKVLPGDVSSSSEWRKRFEREAKAISKLAHPNVCALFDVGRQGDVDYLVMELLTGATLADRLVKGPLPFEEVLRFGAEMASALAATHAMNIAHGDLKPSNVMVMKSGVKLLDFGIARPLNPPGPAAKGGTWASTATAHPAPDGSIVGTLPYMAPEQLDGKEADASTDIFALGAVLFELATGTRAFAGHSRPEVISAVRTSEPPLVSSLQEASPVAFDRLVKTCLAKNPEARWSSAHDISLVLRQLQESPAPPPAARTPSHHWGWSLGAAALAAVCGAAAAVVLRSPRESTAPANSIRFQLARPGENTFLWTAETDNLAVSPDGLQIAYVTVNSKSVSRLWVRRLSELEAHPLLTSEGALSVFWSPDGRSVAFLAQRVLKRIDLPDGAAVTICPVESDLSLSGSWGKGGDILFADGERIMRVAATGGIPSVAVRPSTGPGDFARWPWFLPDGQRFLYVTRRAAHLTLVLAVPGRPPEDLSPVESKVQFAEPGLLLFVRGSALLAQGFDWHQGRLVGAPFSVARQVRSFLTTGAAEYATSVSGTLVLQSADDTARLALLDLRGHELGTVAGSGTYHESFNISPSGAQVAFSRGTPGVGTLDVWLVDMARGVEARITSAAGNEYNPVWLPGEKALVYSTSEGGFPHLVRRDLETGTDASLLPVSGFQLAQDVSLDGSSLLYTESGTVSKLPLSGLGNPVPVLPPGFNIRNVAFSPDGKYVTFISDELGPAGDAYVAPFPGPGARVRISSGGATALRWNRRTATIFFADGERRLWSVPVSTNPVLRVGAPTLLFTAPSGSFDVFPDGKRILVQVPEVSADELPLTVIVNWPAATAR